jgi:hypothetical protein
MAQARQTSETTRGQAPYPAGSSAAERGQPRIPSPVNITAIALRSLSGVYDMQLSAARLALQTQARAAVALGWPDYSELFRLGDGQAKRTFAKGTEQLLHSAQQAGATISEIQRELGTLMERNAEALAESWQQGLEEIGIQAEESLEEMKELTRQQVEEAMRAAESLGDATRQAVRESSEKFRETVRQGAERGRELMSEQGEAVREQGEIVRREGERVAGATRAAAEEVEMEKGPRRGGRAA